MATACGEAGITHPLFMTDVGVKGLSIVADAMEVLADHNLPAVLYVDVQGNPYRTKCLWRRKIPIKPIRLTGVLPLGADLVWIQSKRLHPE